VIGRRIGEFPRFAEYAALWQRTLAQVFASGQPVTVEFELKTPAGLRRFESRAIPEVSADGALCRPGGFPRHHRPRRQRARPAPERRTLSHADRIRQSSESWCKQDGRVRYANSAALQMFGLPDAGRVSLQSDWTEQSRPQVSATSCVPRPRRCCAERTCRLIRAGRFLWKDGSHRWVQSSLTRVEMDGADAVLSFLRDITELHEAADRQSALEETAARGAEARSRRSAGWWHRPRLQQFAPGDRRQRRPRAGPEQ